MLRLVISLLVVSLIASLLGFAGIAHISAEAAKIIFFGFLILLVITILMVIFNRN